MIQLLYPQKLIITIRWNDQCCGKQKHFCLLLAIETCCLAHERITSVICCIIEISYWVSPKYENFETIVVKLTDSVLETLPIFIICVNVMHHHASWRKTREAFKTFEPQLWCSQLFTWIIFHKKFTKSYTNSIINLLPLTLTDFDVQYRSFANSRTLVVGKVGWTLLNKSSHAFLTIILQEITEIKTKTFFTR